MRYIEDKAAESFVYDVVIFDVNSSESESGVSCPPLPFVEENFLTKVIEILDPECGLFLMNLVARSTIKKQEIEKRLCTLFASVGCVKIPGFYLNVLYFCSKRKLDLETREDMDAMVATLLKNTDLLQRSLSVDKFWENMTIVR